MADVGDYIDYIKTLKKGFDKDLFQSKLNELDYLAETQGLDYRDFHTLLKIWLNLTLPIAKWTSLGACLVSQDIIEERTIDYIFQWILANYGNENNFTKIGFVLDWLTVAMECDCIDRTALDSGYELFYSMLTFEALTPHVMKLVYTLTKPSDVNRKRIIELLDYAKVRESKKNMYRQLQVILGLFKSYKPECVPEDVPALPIHTAFKKLNFNLIIKFKKSQERRNHKSKEKQHLIWINPVNAERGRNKKADPLVPNMEFFNIGANQYADKESPKNCLDFADPVSLVQYNMFHCMSRPARLRALLTNETGLTLLAMAKHDEHSLLSYDLHHLLNICFLYGSPHSYNEKRDLLHRVSLLQRTLMQGIPVITRFLAQYLPLWNERDYFSEILELAEWVCIDSPYHISYILGPLMKVYHRAQPMEQCAILRSLTNMYTNLVYASTRTRQHFMAATVPKANYSLVLPKLAAVISDMCGKELQANPDDMRVLFSSVSWSECQCTAEARYSLPVAVLPHRLTLYLPLITVSATLIDKMATLLIVYKKVFTRMKSLLKEKDETYSRHIQILKTYTTDILGWLLGSCVPTTAVMQEQLVEKLRHFIPRVDDMLHGKNHVAFAPYTYAQSYVDYKDTTNKLWYDNIVHYNFPNLDRFLKKAAPEFCESELRIK